MPGILGRHERDDDRDLGAMVLWLPTEADLRTVGLELVG